MSIRNLESLMAPRSVVLIGASERAGSVARVVPAPGENLLKKTDITGGSQLA